MLCRVVGKLKDRTLVAANELRNGLWVDGRIVLMIMMRMMIMSKEGGREGESGRKREEAIVRIYETFVIYLAVHVII